MTKPATVASPCTGVCALDPETGWCAGCMRTIDEITGWAGLDDRGRLAICKRLPARRSALAALDRPEDKP